LELNFWHNRWTNNEIAFHMNVVNPFLKGLVETNSIQGNVLVPLCGKSIDMLYLGTKGLKVTGIELSPRACLHFFSENKIPFKASPSPDRNFTIYSSLDKSNPEIWCGDFFKFSTTDTFFDLVYDRASYIALPLDMRKKMAQALLALPFKYLLLITIHYSFHPEAEDNRTVGPPFSIEDKEVEQLFPGIKKIEAREYKTLSQRNKALKVSRATETAWLLEK